MSRPFVMSTQKTSHADRARQVVGQARQAVEKTTHHVVGSTLDAAVSTGRKVQRMGWKAEKHLDQGVQTMRRNPGTTLAVAFGLGALVAGVCLALSRHKRR